MRGRESYSLWLQRYFSQFLIKLALERFVELEWSQRRGEKQAGLCPELLLNLPHLSGHRKLNFLVGLVLRELYHVRERFTFSKREFSMPKVSPLPNICLYLR